MKIIATTENDFVKAEVEEWGYDYVEAQFYNGYEPTLVSGIWCWRKKALTNVLGSVASPNVSSNTSGGCVYNRPTSVSSLIH